MSSAADQVPHAVPVIRHNDWSVLTPPVLGEWTPTLTVSVVIPAYGQQQILDLVVAALAAQSYPAELLEVVIADDGSPEPIVVPPVAPAQTRVVRVADMLGEGAWGPGAARNAAAAAATGEVLVFMDADMLAFAHQIEAHLRWHHLCSYAVVLGHKHFVAEGPTLVEEPGTSPTVVEEPGTSPTVVEERAPASVSKPTSDSGLRHDGPPALLRARELIAAGRAAELFEGGEPHAWVEQFWKRTSDLTTAGPRAWRVHVGANFSVRRSLFESVGGMDASMRLGEDIDLGWRLQEAGAVSIVDRDARSWHLGPSRLMDEGRRVNEAQDPLLSHRTPGTRPKRQKRGRLYDRPFLEVVVPQASFADAPVIDALLDASMHDLRVRVVCDAEGLAGTESDDRRPLLHEPHLDTRLLRQAYGRDPRVVLTDSEQASNVDDQAPWRLLLGSREQVPAYDALERLLDHAERTHLGLIVIDLPDGGTARLERRAARNRAELLSAACGAPVEALIEQTFGTQQITAVDAGWVPLAEHQPEHFELRPKPAMGVADSMRLLRGDSEPEPAPVADDIDTTESGTKRRWLRGRG